MMDTTPAAYWREDGKPDPHGTHYDCERAKLPKGDLTDDELANAVVLTALDVAEGDGEIEPQEMIVLERLAGLAKIDLKKMLAA